MFSSYNTKGDLNNLSVEYKNLYTINNSKMPRKNKKNSEEQKTTIPDEGTEEYTNWLFKNYTKDSFFKKYITQFYKNH